MRAAVRLAFVATALGAAPAALAVDVGDGQLSLHGNGEWSYQRTLHQNSYLAAPPRGSYENAQFDLLVTARAADDLVITGQMGFDQEAVSAEWVFAEWRFSDRLRLRAGKIFQPLGNYAELRYAGTARPFFTLPTSVYGPSNISADALYGAAITGQWVTEGGWNLGYDLYAGGTGAEEVEPYEALALDPADPGYADAAAEVVETEARHVRDVLGARLSLTPPDDLVLRASAYAGHLGRGRPGQPSSVLTWGLSAMYRGEQLWLSAEGFQIIEFDEEEALSGYVSAAWYFTEHLQGCLRWEKTHVTFEGMSGPMSQLQHHEELAVGLNWWVNPNFVFKGSWHVIDGNRFAFPADITLGELAALTAAGGLHWRTNAFVVGTQFSF